LAGTRNQAEEILGHTISITADWSDIIPEEVKAIREFNEENRQLFVSEGQEIVKLRAEIQHLRKEKSEEKAKIEELQGRLRKAEDSYKTKELELLRKLSEKVPPSLSGGIGTLSPSGSIVISPSLRGLASLDQGFFGIPWDSITCSECGGTATKDLLSDGYKCEKCGRRFMAIKRNF